MDKPMIPPAEKTEKVAREPMNQEQWETALCCPYCESTPCSIGVKVVNTQDPVLGMAIFACQHCARVINCALVSMMPLEAHNPTKAGPQIIRPS